MKRFASIWEPVSEESHSVFNAQQKPSPVRAGERPQPARDSRAGGNLHLLYRPLSHLPPTLPLPLGDHRPHLFSASLEQNGPFGGNLSVLCTLMKIVSPVLPSQRLQQEVVVSTCAVYAVHPHSSWIPYLHTHRAANNSSCPTCHVPN